MIHVDALDFSEWHSEELISFFYCSVYYGASIARTDTLLSFHSNEFNSHLLDMESLSAMLTKGEEMCTWCYNMVGDLLSFKSKNKTWF